MPNSLNSNHLFLDNDLLHKPSLNFKKNVMKDFIKLLSKDILTLGLPKNKMILDKYF